MLLLIFFNFQDRTSRKKNKIKHYKPVESIGREFCLDPSTIRIIGADGEASLLSIDDALNISSSRSNVPPSDGQKLSLDNRMLSILGAKPGSNIASVLGSSRSSKEILSQKSSRSSAITESSSKGGVESSRSKVWEVSSKWGFKMVDSDSNL